ncbi:hypothetical protein Vadar_006382 [Vaccinium darrowii]|uniref:Uncharacterized protein n=1 Tax=Vaccinium darrowii TaxID=229202 RepID=A0ACB7YBY2_9ERIC|nr:hypothetical protein Vadar_006382 [Vaccinium darrowii]
MGRVLVRIKRFGRTIISCSEELYFGDGYEFEEMGSSPSAGRNWIPELSPVANIVFRRCSKILGISVGELRENFDAEASDSTKHPSRYARNILEYCCFRALALSTQVVGYLEDKRFRRLTFDMMLAWEFPAASSQPFINMDEDITVGIEAFSRIASAVPIVSNVIISDNLFEVLTALTDGRLHFSLYEKYLTGLERAIRKFKTQSESSLLSSMRSARGEKILEVDGTVTSQPVLEHVGISTWPGRLILTDHALYFEALRVVSYDKAKRYDLSEDLNQVVKPELTGPWGTRLFDKAVFYKSVSLPEPVVMEFPELKGHARRDYLLAIIREILYCHRFLHKFQITGVERDEALLKATLGILRLQALKEISTASPPCNESLLMFNLCDQLPDCIQRRLCPWLLAWVKESRSNHKKVVFAKATIDGVKVDGIDTNLAVMKELLSPLTEVGKWLLSLAYWEDFLKSSVFCMVSSYIIFRGWLGCGFAFILICMALFMVLTRSFGQGNVEELNVIVPPSMNTMEQLLAVQNAVSQTEELIQDGNIVLLKFRALLLSVFPQASEKCAVALLFMALILAFLPLKYIVLVIFLEIFTKYSPLRKQSTERWTRRLREWWFSIPAAPVVLEKAKEDKKRR